MPAAAPHVMGGIRRSSRRPRASLTSLQQDGASVRAASQSNHGLGDALSVGGRSIQQSQRRGRCASIAAEDTRNRRAVSAPNQRASLAELSRSVHSAPGPAGSAMSAVRALAVLAPGDVGREGSESLNILQVPSPGALLSVCLSGGDADLAEMESASNGIPLLQGEVLPDADAQVAEAHESEAELAEMQSHNGDSPLRQGNVPSEADARVAEAQPVSGIQVAKGQHCSADAVLQKHGYARVKKLGEGSFGTAVLVRGARGLCVCKVIDFRRASTKDQRDALQEGNVLEKLKHPYIVRCQESFVANGWMCIVMRYCSGGSLAGQISQACRRREPFKEDQVLMWFTQALLALKYVHKKHLLHRDLKPDNLFLKSDGTLQMGDFGTCKVLECTLACAMTQVGTPYYLSPEVCQEKPYGCQSDMWSMGCILFELCSLKVPFDAPNISSLVKKICRDPAPQLQSCDWAIEVRAFVDELLAKDPAIRPSAADVLKRQKIQASIERLYVAVQVTHDDDGSADDSTSKRRQRATLPALATPCFHPSPAGAAATEPIRHLCRQAAKTISRTMADSSSHGGVCLRDTMRSDEEESMRQLYLQCIESNPDVILSEIALPLKEELMKTEMGLQLLEGPRRTVTVAAGGVAMDIDKEAFSIGRYAICDVSLPKCRDISRMQLWVFNLPGGLVLVDGWSLFGSAVLARAQAGQELASSEPGSRRAFSVPHDEAVVLKLGGQVVSLNPKPCVVCLDRPRAVQLGCGHRALCGRCAAAAAECPLCKRPVDRSELRDSLGACVGATFAAQPNHAVACAA